MLQRHLSTRWTGEWVCLSLLLLHVHVVSTHLIDWLLGLLLLPFFWAYPFLFSVFHYLFRFGFICSIGLASSLLLRSQMYSIVSYGIACMLLHVIWLQNACHMIAKLQNAKRVISSAKEKKQKEWANPAYPGCPGQTAVKWLLYNICYVVKWLRIALPFGRLFVKPD